MFALTAVMQKNFFAMKSIVRNINSFTPLILLTMGQAVVIISGGLDLSVGTALSLLTCVATSVMRQGLPITGVYALLVTFAVAMAMGLINGIGIGFFRVPPLIVTFATSYIWLGIALFLRPTPGGETVDWFQVFYKIRNIESAPASLKAFGEIIPPALVLIILGCILWWIISRTKTGRYIYAVGGNSESAYVTGINTSWVQIKACLINSVFIFLAALFFVGQSRSGDARMGDPLTLKAIAAVVVGGIALTGGRGSVYYAFVGALIFSFVSKIIFFANIPNAFQTLFSGVIIIIAIAGSQLYTLSSRKEMEESKLT
ncbi:MAG: ABC transporter permease [Spirochaetes bacterium]|nr:ABC transporter permease [Spirochaetota bacterium]